MTDPNFSKTELEAIRAIVRQEIKEYVAVFADVKQTKKTIWERILK